MQERDITALEQLKKNKKLEPYINYIRFPCFKNLELNTQIDFDFPLTVIVGQNGTNKSSILRAIQGCPEGYSLGNFWFSTDLDPIIGEGNKRPRYIYGYFQPQAKRNVEVIKTRIQRNYSGSQKVNPDYWEPSRPLKSDGMEDMPELKDGEKLLGRTKSRWNLISKDVVFLDFRSEISSYDKFFYHGDLSKRTSYKSKQDFIRRRSGFLKEVVDEELSSKKLFRGQKEHVQANKLLSDSERHVISAILGRDYTRIRLVEHRFFDMNGSSVILESNDLKYSEAFAGSGEFAVVMLVHKVLSAKEASLIILDEPEVSLHPGAQIRLVNFLIQEIKAHKHQVVIGSHSPFIIGQLPKQAIKTLFNDPSINEVRAIHETYADEAFFHLGSSSDAKYRIFVEDALAAEFVLRALRLKGEATFKLFEVVFMPGGVADLRQSFILPEALSNGSRSLFILDGDERSRTKICQSGMLDIPDNQLDQVIQDLSNGQLIKFPKDGGKDPDIEKKLIKNKRQFCDFFLEYVSFLPGNGTPEDFILENLGEDPFEVHQVHPKGDAKERFRQLAKLDLGKEVFEDVSSGEILSVQKGYLTKLNSDFFDPVVNSIDEFLGKQ